MNPLRFGFITYGLERPAFGISRSVLRLGGALQRHASAEPVFLTPYRRGPFVDTTSRHVHLPGARLMPGLMTVGALELPLVARRAGLPLIHDPTGVTPFIVGRWGGDYKRVVTLHDATPFLYPETHTLLDNFLHRVYVPAVLRNVDAVITDSEASRGDLSHHLHLPGDKLEVVPLGVEPMFRPLPPDTREAILDRYRLTEPFLLYVGALEPRKNLPTLLRAFARLHAEFPQVQLAVAGGRRWKSSGLPRLVQELGVGDSVRFTGYVPDADLPALYSAAEAFCFPSLAEGFGLPALEAMACGTPVICSNVSSLPEVAGEAGVLVDPTNPDAVAAGLITILRDPILRQELRERGLKRAAQFSWESTAERTLEVYRSVLIGPRQSPDVTAPPQIRPCSTTPE